MSKISILKKLALIAAGAMILPAFAAAEILPLSAVFMK